MKYLLDTCVVSDFVKGDVNTLARLKAEQPKDLAISSVTLMELKYGLALSSARTKKISPVLDMLLEMIQVIPYEQIDANATAVIRAHLKKEGTPIGPYDVMIAGCALAHQLMMVTSNTKEFDRVAGLSLENWR